MKTIIVIIACLFLNLVSVAQDIIYKKDKTKIEAKILVVSRNEVRYLQTNNLTGPEYVLPKSDILLISYSNGTFESIVYRPYGISRYDNTFNQNILNFNMGDLLSYVFSLSYERVVKNGMLGIKVPIRKGFGTAGYSGQGLQYSIGLDLNFYPTGQGRLKYYFGPSIETGSIEEYEYNYSSFSLSYDYYDIFFVSTYINNGLMWQITKQISISTAFGLGVRNSISPASAYPANPYPAKNSTLTGRFEYNIGYRF